MAMTECIEHVLYHVPIGYIDKEEAQRAVQRLYKIYREDIGIDYNLASLPKRKQEAVNKYWAKKDEEAKRKAEINSNRTGEPPSKRQRIGSDKEENDKEQKEMSPTPQATDSNHNFNNNSNSRSNDAPQDRSNHNSNHQPLPQFFRFNEKFRVNLFKKCIDANIMSFGVAFRDEKFNKIWNELICEDVAWSAATLQRVKDEFYNKHKDVLKLIKNGKQAEIARESNKLQLAYIESIQAITNTLNYHDGFS